jgi:hypothetical protein
VSETLDQLLRRDSAIAMEAAVERLYVTAMEYRAERDSAREQARLLQKCIDDADLSQLLSDLDEYMGNRADADGDSEGFHPNKEMQLQGAIAQALTAFGWEA